MDEAERYCLTTRCVFKNKSFLFKKQCYLATFRYSIPKYLHLCVINTLGFVFEVMNIFSTQARDHLVILQINYLHLDSFMIQLVRKVCKRIVLVFGWHLNNRIANRDFISKSRL